MPTAGLPTLAIGQGVDFPYATLPRLTLGQLGGPLIGLPTLAIGQGVDFPYATLPKLTIGQLGGPLVGPSKPSET